MNKHDPPFEPELQSQPLRSGFVHISSTTTPLHAHLASLTLRERQVLELIIRSKTNKQASLALGCTERTIKAHRKMVMEKCRSNPSCNSYRLPERSLRRCKQRQSVYNFDYWGSEEAIG